MGTVKVKLSSPVDLVVLQNHLEENNSSRDISFCAEELASNMVEHKEEGYIKANGVSVDLFIDKKTLTPNKKLSIYAANYIAKKCVDDNKLLGMKILNDSGKSGGLGFITILLKGFDISLSETSKYLRIKAYKPL